MSFRSYRPSNKDRDQPFFFMSQVDIICISYLLLYNIITTHLTAQTDNTYFLMVYGSGVLARSSAI